MAERESTNQYPSGLLETDLVSGDEAGNAGAMEKLELYLNLAEGCLDAVLKMSSQKFNNEQCGYLVDKLKVVVQSANSFLQVLRSKHHEYPCSFVDITKQVEIFKFLFALAKQTESFVQGCCKDAWIQAAMTLTNVSEYVSSLGFNLELCKVAFCKQCAATGSLTLDEIDDINNIEVKIVEKKVCTDVDTLFRKVILEMPSLSSENKDLASYLIQRLKGVKAIPTSLLEGSSWWSFDDDGGLFRKLFKWVKPEERLGRGASATVYRAMWLGTPVAKKTFYGPENPDFLKEVEILSRLCHPNITSMYCCAKNERSCSIIMELMDGDFYTLMERRLEENSNSPPFSIFEAVDIMLQVGEGVNYLHNQGIVHRDLKSMNILFKSIKATNLENGYVYAKLVDFGLSKTKARSATYSNQTYNMGTNRWMAPEIIKLATGNQGSPSGSDTMQRYPFKCDIYSFGMFCYEILTGHVPFFASYNPNEIKAKVMEGERPDLPDECPLKLKALIEKCWNQEPLKRPTSAEICLELKYVKYLLMKGETIQENNLTALTSLKMDGSSGLEQLPEDVGNMKTLTTLVLDGYSRLKELPKSVGNLTTLMTLNLNSCSSLTKLPRQIGNLTTLTTLILDGCSSLKELPSEIGNLTVLMTLNLDGCSSLTELPRQIGNLTTLTTLSLDGCSSLKQLPSEIGNLTTLMTLKLDGCSSLSYLGESVGNLTALTTLSLNDCSNLMELPKQIGNLTVLTSLSLDDCSSLKQIPDEIGNLKALTTLIFDHLNLLQIPSKIGKLAALMTLSLNGCSRLKWLPWQIGNLAALTTLSLDGCSRLTTLPRQIGKLVALTTLSLYGCSSLDQLPYEIGNLPTLTTLILDRLTLVKLPGAMIGELAALTTLRLNGCLSLKELPWQIGILMTLMMLSLNGCSSLTELPREIGNLRALTTLRLDFCSSLNFLPESVGNLTALTTLILDGCSSLKELPLEIANLTALTTLSVNGCSNLNLIPPDGFDEIECEWLFEPESDTA